MGRDFLRKCSQCGLNGHNSRTCNGKSCIRLFGVDINTDHCGNGNDHDHDHDHQEIQDEAIRKCKSMENLPTCNHEGNDVDVGYLSDGLIHKSSNAHSINERKKGIPWSEDEHRSFLIGLEKLGKGDWKGISKNFVPSRNPTQVASHAQKYFLRASSAKKRRRRSSLFDIPFDALCSTNQVGSEATPQKTSEAPQAGTPVVAPSQLNNAIDGQDSLLKAFLKPPLSAGARIAPQRRMPYMVGLHNAQVRMPIPTHFDATKIAYSPVLGFPYLNQIIPPNLPSSSTLPPLPFGPCQADATIKDTLDLSIVALKL